MSENKYPKRKMKKLARLYVASMLRMNSEIHAETPEAQAVADELGPYLEEIADELLSKSGEVDTCVTFDECAKKLILPFKLRDEN